MYLKIRKFIGDLQSLEIPDERKSILRLLIDYIRDKIDSTQSVALHFICTHNSRRSQFAQVWATTMAALFDLPVNAYSGGVEVTAFNPRAVASLERVGYRIEAEHNINNSNNPIYHLKFGDDIPSITAFSKLYDHKDNPSRLFAAVMTCSHADDNCPFIPGADVRIPLLFDDPKEYDGTSLETKKYDERSMQIASELYYTFSQVRK